MLTYAAAASAGTGTFRQRWPRLRAYRGGAHVCQAHGDGGSEISVIRSHISAISIFACDAAFETEASMYLYMYIHKIYMEHQYATVLPRWQGANSLPPHHPPHSSSPLLH
jgi:hypothetical protein